MRKVGIKHKILAAALAAGIVFSMQGFTAAAGTMGMGSSAQSEQSGPGVVSQEQTVRCRSTTAPLWSGRAGVRLLLTTTSAWLREDHGFPP